MKSSRGGGGYLLFQLNLHLHPKKSHYCKYYYLITFFLLIILNQFHSTVSLTSLKARIVLVRDLYQESSSSPAGGQSVNVSKSNSNNGGPRSVLIEEIFNEKPNSDTILKLTDDMERGSVTVKFECVAAYPISWIYEGLGSPQTKRSQVYTESRRTFEVFGEPQTFRYFATLYLRKLEEKNTGKYFCRSLKDPEVEIFYYVFVQGPKFFVTDSGLSIAAKRNEQKLIIPCAVTHPTQVKTALFKVDDMGHPERVNLTTFDPRIGFTLLYQDHPSPWGQYVCTGGNASMTHSIIVNVDPPKKFVIRPTIKSGYVHLDENIKQRFICEAKDNVTIKFSTNLTRPANPVSHQFDPEREFPFVASFESDPRIFSNFSLISCVSHHYHHPDSSNSSAEQRTHSDNHEGHHEKILHTWEYSAYGNDKNLTLSYDGQLDGFLCCTVDSAVVPEMTPSLPCSSPQECQLRNFRSKLQNYRSKKWLTSSSSSSSSWKDTKVRKKIWRKRKDVFNMENMASTRAKKEENQKMFRIWSHYLDPSSKIDPNVLPVGCSGLKRAREVHMGFFHCSVQSGEKIDMKDFFYSSLKSKPVFSVNDVPQDDLISILHPQSIVSDETGNNNNETMKVEMGQSVEVSCQVNNFLFSQGHVWAFERSNGNIQVVPDDLLANDMVPMKTTTTTQNFRSLTSEFDRIQFPSKEIVRLYCFAPLWDSAEWRNSSISIQVI